jgi:hypothetical protein
MFMYLIATNEVIYLPKWIPHTYILPYNSYTHMHVIMSILVESTSFHGFLNGRIGHDKLILVISYLPILNYNPPELIL